MKEFALLFLYYIGGGNFVVSLSPLEETMPLLLITLNHSLAINVLTNLLNSEDEVKIVFKKKKSLADTFRSENRKPPLEEHFAQ